MSSAAAPGPAPRKTGLVWAQTSNGVIGAAGDMPWHLPEDLAHFKRTTSGHPLIMGRRTWESFPPKYRPLPDRTNIVITRQKSLAGAPELDGAVVLSSLEEALEAAAQAPGAEQIWIIGGGMVFEQAMDRADTAVVTVIDLELDGDTFAPALTGWRRTAVEPAEGWHESRNGTRYRIEHWEKPA